jgi:hypothetical protein
MDARGVQRVLDKTFGLAETALTVGAKSADMALRDARLSDEAKAKMLPLYAEESLKRTLNYAGLGLALCGAIENEPDDEAARAQLEWYRVRLRTIYRDAHAAYQRDFGGSTALEFE